jgi:hypothetical protein
MHRSLRLNIYATAAFLAVAFLHLVSVARAEEPRTVTLSIGSDTSMLGSTLVLPLAIDNPDNVEIQSLSVELLLPSEAVSLTSARTSLAMETAGGTVETDTKADESGGKVQRITFRISAPKPLPNGRLASLELRLAEKLPNTKEVPLTLEKGTVTTADSKATPASLQSGKITISDTAPTLVNCFFFTH